MCKIIKKFKNSQNLLDMLFQRPEEGPRTFWPWGQSVLGQSVWGQSVLGVKVSRGQSVPGSKCLFRWLGSKCPWGQSVSGVKVSWGQSVPGVKVSLGSKCLWGQSVSGVKMGVSQRRAHYLYWARNGGRLSAGLGSQSPSPVLLGLRGRLYLFINLIRGL